MKVETYEGKPFRIHIDRSTMVRGYVLSVEDEKGNWIPQHEALKRLEFEKHFGFSPVWPHETT
jgi:hypothetical protein